MSGGVPSPETAAAVAAESKGICWALHDFEAENEDELSFFAGEQIIITQRDELYGDGWFEVSLDLPEMAGRIWR